MSNFWDNLSGIFFKRKLLFRGNSCYSAHTLRNVGLRGNGKGWQHKLGNGRDHAGGSFYRRVILCLFRRCLGRAPCSDHRRCAYGSCNSLLFTEVEGRYNSRWYSHKPHWNWTYGFSDIRAHRRPLYHNLAAKRRIAPDQHPRHTGYTNSRKRAFGSQCAYICFLHGRCGHILPTVQNKSGPAHMRCG